MAVFNFEVQAGIYSGVATNSKFVLDHYYAVIHGMGTNTSFYIQQCTTNGQLNVHGETGSPLYQFNNIAIPLN